jgi:hypothetical protein
VLFSLAAFLFSCLLPFDFPTILYIAVYNCIKYNI